MTKTGHNYFLIKGEIIYAYGLISGTIVDDQGNTLELFEFPGVFELADLKW